MILTYNLILQWLGDVLTTGNLALTACTRTIEQDVERRINRVLAVDAIVVGQEAAVLYQGAQNHLILTLGILHAGEYGREILAPILFRNLVGEGLMER